MLNNHLVRYDTQDNNGVDMLLEFIGAKLEELEDNLKSEDSEQYEYFEQLSAAYDRLYDILWYAPAIVDLVRERLLLDNADNQETGSWYSAVTANSHKMAGVIKVIDR